MIPRLVASVTDLIPTARQLSKVMPLPFSAISRGTLSISTRRRSSCRRTTSGFSRLTAGLKRRREIGESRDTFLSTHQQLDDGFKSAVSDGAQYLSHKRRKIVNLDGRLRCIESPQPPTIFTYDKLGSQLITTSLGTGAVISQSTAIRTLQHMWQERGLPKLAASAVILALLASRTMSTQAVIGALEQIRSDAYYPFATAVLSSCLTSWLCRSSVDVPRAVGCDQNSMELALHRLSVVVKQNIGVEEALRLNEVWCDDDHSKPSWHPSKLHALRRMYLHGKGLPRETSLNSRPAWEQLV